jgi:hypothetical protein
MKRNTLWFVLLLLAPASAVYASDVGFNAGVSVGFPGVGVSVGVGAPGYSYQEAPAYAYREAPAYPYQQVEIEEPPVFVQPPELGFYAAVGVPYNLFFLNNLYYLFSGNAWFASPYYNGPWSSIYYGDLPYALNRYPFERIRYFRDDYYGRYQRYGAWDGYRHFRPDRHGWGREGYGRRVYSYSRPNGPGHAYGERPSYNRQYSRGQRYGDGRVYSRPNSYSQSYGARPVYSRPNTSGRNYGNRPSYSRPYNNFQANTNRTAYTRPYSHGQGGGSTVSYSRPNNSGQGFSGRHSYSRQNSPSQGTTGRHGGSGPGSYGHGNGERRGHGR